MRVVSSSIALLLSYRTCHAESATTDPARQRTGLAQIIGEQTVEQRIVLTKVTRFVQHLNLRAVHLGDTQQRRGAADVARLHFLVRCSLGSSAAAALATYHSYTPCGLMSCSGYGGMRRPFVKLRIISALFSPLTSITT